LQIGGLSGTGLLLSDLFRARAQAAPARHDSFGRASSLIVLYLHGGHAQQETWDPKPDGPQPARGEFGAIATSVPGVHISELLPHSARLLHKLAVIRSLSHPNANHVQASLPAMTGHAHPPSEEARGDFPPSPMDFPPFGAVLDHLRPAGKLPTWVQVGPLMRRANGTVLHGQSPGFLGTRHGPLVIDQDLLPADVRVDAVASDPELSLDRLSGRRDLLQHLDSQRRLLEHAAETRSVDAHQQRALNLLTSPAVARAFQLGAEPGPVRDHYGRTQFGQCCLLARRLAEAPWSPTWISAGCWVGRWCWPRRSSAGRRRSTTPAAAITGRGFTPRPWPAVEQRPASSTAPQTRSPRIRHPMRTTRAIWWPPSITSSACRVTRSFMIKPTGRIRWSLGRRLTDYSPDRPNLHTRSASPRLRSLPWY
jgi:hypothetical protein